MVFKAGGKTYRAGSALELVRKIERDTDDYPHKGCAVAEFLRWSLGRLDDRIPLRELDLSSEVSEDTLALGYLCLLDEYGLGELRDPSSDLLDKPAAETLKADFEF
jgi:hypothetical protein